MQQWCEIMKALLEIEEQIEDEKAKQLVRGLFDQMKASYLSENTYILFRLAEAINETYGSAKHQVDPTVIFQAAVQIRFQNIPLHW